MGTDLSLDSLGLARSARPSYLASALHPARARVPPLADRRQILPSLSPPPQTSPQKASLSHPPANSRKRPIAVRSPQDLRTRASVAHTPTRWRR